MTKNNYNLKDLSNEESEKQNKKTIDLSNSEIEEKSNYNYIIEWFEQNDGKNYEEIKNKFEKVLEEKDNKLSKVNKILQEKLDKIEELIIDKKKSDDNINRLNNIEIPKLVKDKEEIIEKLSLYVVENSLLKEKLEVNNLSNYHKFNKNLTQEKKSSNLVNTNNNIISDYNNPDDTNSLKILLEIITIFKEIKKLIRKMNCNIHEHYYEVNLKEQDNDDLLFYHSIILDSKKNFIKSYKVREKKLINDLNNILKMIYNNRLFNKISEINATTFKIIKKSYDKLSLEAKNNNTYKPLWVRNDIKSINTEMNRIFSYHKNINLYFKDCLITEIKFFKMNT